MHTDAAETQARLFSIDASSHCAYNLAAMTQSENGVTFEIRRVDIAARTLDELEGPTIATFEVDGEAISGDDTVEIVMGRVRTLIAQAARHHADPAVRQQLQLMDEDELSLWFSGRRMDNAQLFYAGHFMLLPAYVQAVIHRCSVKRLFEILEGLR